MSENAEFVGRVFMTGVGATTVMDLWALMLRQFGIPSLNFAYLGRWLGHLPEGQFIHDKIALARPVRGERVMGWLAHYFIGVSFSAEARVMVPARATVTKVLSREISMNGS